MPFTQHLEELRWHILRSLFYVLLLGCVCWWQYDPIYRLIAEPLKQAYSSSGQHFELVFLDFLEPLFFRLQVVLAAAVLLSLPLMLWEAWRFVAPGLYPQERRFAAPLLPFGLVLCVGGMVLIYYAMPLAIGFLLKFAPVQEQDPVRLMQQPQRYFFFLLRMMIAAAITFQMPIVMLLLGQLELVTAAGLVRLWRHAVLLCFTLAAVITPTIDPVNMSIIAVPLVALYFLSVVLVWLVERSKARTARRAPEPEPPAVAAPLPALPSEAAPPAALVTPQPVESLLLPAPEAPDSTPPVPAPVPPPVPPVRPPAEADEALFDPDADR